MGCKSNTVYIPQTEIVPLKQNDSVQKFLKLQREMIRKVEQISSSINPITTHFNKYITEEDLRRIQFKETKKNIYIEFTLDKYKNIRTVTSNASYSKLDKHLKKSFNELDFDLLDIDHFNPRYKYTLVIIQNEGNMAIVKCSQKPIGYIPPVFEHCSDKMSYNDLHKCNYSHITDYLHSNIDLSSITSIDIEKNHKILPKFIIDKQGKVIAAKIESQNKDLIESYYKTLMSLPKAISSAKLNGTDYYYGYNFPTSVKKVILNNANYREFYYERRHLEISTEKIMKEFISTEYGKDLE